MSELIEKFGCLQYNEMSLIRDLVSSAAQKYLKSHGITESFNIWYEKNYERIKSLYNWQSTASELLLLGLIYYRCEEYEKICRKALEKELK